MDDRVWRIGIDLLEQARSNQSGLLSSRFWNDKLMDWAMKDEAFKVQLFRFVDAFPNFKTSEAVYEHLVDFMGQPGVSPPPGMRTGLKAGAGMKGVVAKTMSSQITAMAEKFIAGTDAKSAVETLRKGWDDDMAFSVDLLGEACVSDAEADAYQAKYLDLVEQLPAWVDDWPDNPRLERDHLGSIPRTNVSVKVSSLVARFDPIAWDRSLDDGMQRLVPILKAAAKRGVFVNFDMEEFAIKDLTIELFKRCCDEVEFEAGIAMQAYLRSGDADAREVIDWAKGSGRAVTVRLVKGAYWDYETIHAEQMGWPVPVWSTKGDTDACFERMASKFIEATPREVGQGGVKLALGSHNVRSIAFALAALEAADLPREAIELQMLYGMADPLKAAAVEQGLRLREYVPVGEMIPGMAYLVRRLLENTSNESWLKAGLFDNASPEALLADPAKRQGLASVHSNQQISRAEQHRLSDSVPELEEPKYRVTARFFSEPIRDFADADQREAFATAVKHASVPSIANDATVEDVDAAVAEARGALDRWRKTDVLERSRCLDRAANLMCDRRDELAALVIRDNGKDWRNADADVCEAIDFCRFYARQAVALFRPHRLGRFVGELNEQWHEPRGVAAVISPWNFPLAIPCGMTVAALVTGNSTLLKPAEQTPACAAALCEILWEAGVPRDVLHLLCGPGESVGQHLARHPGINLVAFTGSSEVGRSILNDAAAHPPRGQLARHVVCETGGKNAIIVDASADLDQAVVGVRESAFGFAGQKCSACSRAIVVDEVFDVFLRRLIDATRSLQLGDPADPATEMGPLVDTEAAAKVLDYIRVGQGEGRLAYPDDASTEPTSVAGKPLVPPHIFTDVSNDARIATEEIFGPVLTVIRARDFDHGLQLANDSDFKLTGGVYTRKPSHLAQARREFRVGNLYLNRGCTGALVGRQPFGGFGRSGLGTKAGGDGYLHEFVVPRACAENTMRRGFAPMPADDASIATESEAAGP